MSTWKNMASPGINSIPSVSGHQPDIMPTLSGAGYGNYPVQNKTYLYSLLIHMLAAALIVAATTYVANNPEKVQQQLQSINLDLSDYVFNAGDSGAGGGVSPPIPIYKPDPEYSEEARKAKYQGAVILWIVVGPDGRVHNMRVARSLGLGLDEKAMEAVRTWKFEPAKKDGQAVAVQLNIEVSFRLY